MTEFHYQIYIKNECVYHCLSEEEFRQTWDMLIHLVDLLSEKITKDDITFEKVSVVSSVGTTD